MSLLANLFLYMYEWEQAWLCPQPKLNLTLRTYNILGVTPAIINERLLGPIRKAKRNQAPISVMTYLIGSQFAHLNLTVTCEDKYESGTSISSQFAHLNLTFAYKGKYVLGTLISS